MPEPPRRPWWLRPLGAFQTGFVFGALSDLSGCSAAPVLRNPDEQAIGFQTIGDTFVSGAIFGALFVLIFCADLIYSRFFEKRPPGN